MAIDTSISVLIVDDNTIMRRIVRRYLETLGFRDIDEASDGAAALGRLEARKYGLIMSDWNMQPMSGYDLLRAVRADRVHRSVPFILATSESKTANIVAARRAGTDAYIIKPFTQQTLRARIEAVLLTGQIALRA